jgi:hypothetical protein
MLITDHSGNKEENAISTSLDQLQLDDKGDQLDQFLGGADSIAAEPISTTTTKKKEKEKEKEKDKKKKKSSKSKTSAPVVLSPSSSSEDEDGGGRRVEILEDEDYEDF